MNYLFKSIIVCLLCICFAYASIHMPYFSQAIFNAIFESFDGAQFLFVISIAICIITILRKWINNINGYYTVISITFIVSALVLFKGKLDLPKELEFGIDDTLLDKGNENIPQCPMNKWIFMEYYFDDKALIISSEENERDDKNQYVYRMAISPQKVLTDEKIDVSNKKIEEILSYPYYDDAPYYFVLDEYWENTDRIRLVEAEDKYIFCSEEIINSGVKEALNNRSLETEESDAVSTLREIVRNRPYKNIKQIIVIFSLFGIGLVITLALWGERYLALAFMGGLPIGAALWCICGIVFMILNIPYNLFSMLGGLIFLEGIWIFSNRSKYREVNWKCFYDFMLLTIMAIVLVVYAKAYFTSYDSSVKCAMGYRLAKFGSLRDILAYAAPYGMLEPMIMSIGFIVKCDILYAYYPLMALSGIGLICTGIYYLQYKKRNTMAMLVLGGGLIFLLTNGDYILGSFYIMAHGPIAVYILVFLMMLVMKSKINMPGACGIAALAATMILVTRVEGAVYILFILIASLGIENEYLKLKKINILVPVIIIIWNGVQIIFIGRDTNPLFWTPNRGGMLIIASMGVIFFSLLIDKNWALFAYVKSRICTLVMIAVGAGVVFSTVFLKRGMAAINFPVYLAHFSNSTENTTNSAALWTFVLFISMMALCSKQKIAKYSTTIIWGYVLLVYFICLFRGDAPLRMGVGDSARRTLVQIMPAMVWLLTVSAGEIEKLLKSSQENRCI